MKKILMAVVAVILLGGGGAGGYLYFVKPAEAAVGEEAAAKAEAFAKKEKEKEKVKYKFVELAPLILPILDDSGLSQTVSLVVTLEVMGEKVAYEVEAMAPKLQDAFIQDMYGVLNRHAALKGGVIQVSYIKKRLNRISQKVMGKDKVHDVLLQVVQQRPI